MERRRKSKARAALALILAAAIAAALVPAGAFAAAGEIYAYDRPGDKDYMTNTAITERTETANASRKIVVDRAQGAAQFTGATLAVDGVREAAWDAATAYPVSHMFNGALTATAASGAAGTVRFLWDGPVLYALVEVAGDTSAATANQTWTGASLSANASADGVVFGIDVFNDQWGMENDTTTWFYVNQNASSYAVYGGTNIPSLSSFLYTSCPDYSPRVLAVKGSAYNAATNAEGVSYTYEAAIDIEGWGDVWDYELGNGSKVGVEVGIMDGSKTWAFWSKTNATDAREGSSNLPNDERARNRDWGEVTLAGWDGDAPFAYSSFSADEAIRFWNSPNNPGAGGNYLGTGNGDLSEVWRADTKARMIAAETAYLAVKDDGDVSRADKEAAILEVCEAFAGLRWADETFPDPHDLPINFTIPDPYKFFDASKGTGGYVTTPAEWEERKAEILALAEFYEYGYKPRLGVDYTISVTTNNYAGSGNATVTASVVPTNTGHWRNGTAQNVTVTISNPQLYNGQKAGVGFGVSGNGLASTTNGTWPFGDTRSDSVWGTRAGNTIFTRLFPYERNRAGADVSNAMAYATGVSVALDILEAACAANSALDARIDTQKAATSGFSYAGKYAFVAAVYDERVKVTFSGAAGATGPANWRYNVQGQEYDFSETIYSNTGSQSVIAFGTEGPGNSYRHNRARETELFRHFMPYGHMYEHLDGAYNYGEYSRMPIDNALLLAAFVPDRMIVLDNCLNDFNDGAGTDNMSFQLARAMYKAMGADPDAFVKINSANYASSGDPHGVSAGRLTDSQIASDFLFGTSLVSDEGNARLLADPFNLLVANGRTQSAYDYYWGGFNTITGGTGGIDGRDGWYYKAFASISPSAAIASRGKTVSFTAAANGFGEHGGEWAWTLSGAQSPGTALSGAGALEVAEDEAATALTVTATLVSDSSVSASLTLAVQNSSDALAETVAAAAAATAGTVEADYTAETWAAYSAALATAEAILLDPDADGLGQEALNDAAASLAAALSLLRPEKSGLDAAIGEAQSFNGDKYTVPTYNELVLALGEALAAYGSPDASVARVKAAIAGINSAIGGLEEIEIEEGIKLDALQGLIDRANAAELRVYGEAGVEQLKAALAEAQELIDLVKQVLAANETPYASPYGMAPLSEITQADIDAAYGRIILLLGSLEAKQEYRDNGYLDTLITELTSVLALDHTAYTGESFAKLWDEALKGWTMLSQVVSLVENEFSPATVDGALATLNVGESELTLLLNGLLYARDHLEAAPAGGPGLDITVGGGVYSAGNKELVLQYVSGAEAVFDFKVADFENVGVAILDISVREDSNLNYGAVSIAGAPGTVASITPLNSPVWPGYKSWQAVIYADDNAYLTLGDGATLFSVSVPLIDKADTAVLLSVTGIDMSFLDAATGSEIRASVKTLRPSDSATVKFRNRFDINMDGKVDIVDVGLVRRYLGAAQNALTGEWEKPTNLDAALWDAAYAERCNLNATWANDAYVFDIDGNLLFDDYSIDTIDLSLALAAYSAAR
ncbi:MAG: hypothetical protein LBL83_12590 [Clostridiales bacterium]|jgi:hypothetical protein|nr:hypothetical protein [Clostridiales bacterium]